MLVDLEEKRAKHRERQRLYRQRHPDRVKELNRSWRKKNPDAVREKNAKWRRDHPSEMRVARQRWVNHNRARHRATRNAWQSRNRERINRVRRERYARRSEEIRTGVNEGRLQRKQILVKLLGGKCLDCGMVPHIAAFEFDHVNGEKRASISALLAGAALWEQALAEIKKCELVCANCHRIRTAERTTKV